MTHSESLTSLTQIIMSIYGDPAGYDDLPKDHFKGFVGVALGASAAAAQLFDPSVLEPVFLEYDDGTNSTTLTASCYRSIFEGALPYPTKVTETLDGNGTVILTEKESTYATAWDETREQYDKSVVDPFRFIFEEVDVKHNGEYVENDMKIRTYSAAIWLQFNGMSLSNVIPKVRASLP